MLFRRSLLFHYMRPYTGRILFNVLLRVLSAVFTTVLVFAVAPLMGLLFGTGGAGEPSGAATAGGSPAGNGVANHLFNIIEHWVNLSIAAHGKGVTLALVVGALFLAYFLKDFCAYMGLYGFTPIRNKVAAALRNDLFHKYLILPLSYYTRAEKGDLLTRISHDVQEVDSRMLNQIQQVLVDVITLVFLIVMLFLISVPLSLFVLVLLPVIAGITGFVSRSLKKKSKKLQNTIGAVSSQMTQTLEGAKTLRSYNANADALGRFMAKIGQFYDLNRRVGRRVYLASPLNEVLGTAAVVLVLIAGGWLILHEGSLRPEVFIAYLVTMIQLLPSSKNVISAWFTIRSGRGSLARIKEVLREAEVVVEKPDAKRVGEMRSCLEFRDVCFSHHSAKRWRSQSRTDFSPFKSSTDFSPCNQSKTDFSPLKVERTSVRSDIRAEARTTLTGISLKIKKGKFIALVGPSGGGKSTLLNMIPRFYDPDSGQVLIDGTDLRDCRISDLRALSSLVSQDTVLFNDTVYNNILLGNPQASREEIEESARLSDAHNFITQLENGYQTNIGDSGSKLSGGQRQRLAIARALVKKAPILLFDEATSALDSETENRIMQAVMQRAREQGQTVIAIAHRLSSVRHADEIVVIENGRITGRGTHEELSASHPLYRRLSK